MVTTSMILRVRSQKATSMGKRIPRVWTALEGEMSRAPSIPSRPRRPRVRAQGVAATSKGARISSPRVNHATELHVEPDLQDVAVGDLVVLPLHPQLAGRLGGVPGSQCEKLVPGDHLGPDEAPLEV